VRCQRQRRRCDVSACSCCHSPEARRRQLAYQRPPAWPIGGSAGGLRRPWPAPRLQRGVEKQTVQARPSAHRWTVPARTGPGYWLKARTARRLAAASTRGTYSNPT